MQSVARAQTVLASKDMGLSSPDAQAEDSASTACFILILMGRVFSHSFSKCFLSIYYVPGSYRPRDTVVNKRALPFLLVPF